MLRAAFLSQCFPQEFKLIILLMMILLNCSVLFSCFNYQRWMVMYSVVYFLGQLKVILIARAVVKIFDDGP